MQDKLISNIINFYLVISSLHNITIQERNYFEIIPSSDKTRRVRTILYAVITFPTKRTPERTLSLGDNADYILLVND